MPIQRKVCVVHKLVAWMLILIMAMVMSTQVWAAELSSETAGNNKSSYQQVNQEPIKTKKGLIGSKAAQTSQPILYLILLIGASMEIFKIYTERQNSAKED